MKVKFFIAWFDMWIGAYWSKQHKTLYICPLPCCVIALQFIRDGKIQAPFTQKEQNALNEYQITGPYHPYTCGNNSDHLLFATKYGWVCSKCDYTQNWAHSASVSMIKNKE